MLITKTKPLQETTFKNPTPPLILRLRQKVLPFALTLGVWTQLSDLARQFGASWREQRERV